MLIERYVIAYCIMKKTYLNTILNVLKCHCGLFYDVIVTFFFVW